MGFRIGSGSGRRPFITPETQGMSGRANQRLEHLVAAHNVRTAEALRIDGVRTLIWNKGAGRYRCSCSLGVDNDSTNTDALGEYKVLGNSVRSTPKAEAQPQNTISTVKEKPREVFGDSDDWSVNFNHPQEAQARQRQLNLDDHATEVVYEDDPAADLAALTDEIGTLGFDADLADDNDASNSFAADFINGNNIKCPVCASSSFVDSWQLYGGHREIMSFLRPHQWETKGGRLELTSRPNVLILSPGQTVAWTMNLPMYLTEVLRFGFFESHRLVSDHVVMMNGQPYSPQALIALLAAGVKPTFSLRAERRLLLTHCEAMTLLANPVYTQFPQINLPHEREYADYNTTATVEIGAETVVHPGAILVDYKYRRAWRVTAMNKKSTAGGRTLTQSADCRMVNGFEPYSILNPFEFSTDDGSKKFKGRNESMQGG